MRYTIERKLLHHYADMVQDQDMEEVKRVLQEYVARVLNQRYEQIREKENKQT